MRKLHRSVAMLAFVACVSAQAQAQAQRGGDDRSVTCEGAEACSYAWRRAQAWVATKTVMPVRITTDAVIETARPGLYARGWGFKVTRLPITPKVDRITLEPICAPGSTCSHDPAFLFADFAAFVTPPPSAN